MRLFIVCLFVLKTVNANCTLPSTFENGTLEVLYTCRYNKVIRNNTRIKIVCNDGFKPYPLPITTCRDVSTGKAKCINNAKLCTLPPKFEYGRSLEVLNNDNGVTLEDTQIKIICNEGFKPYPSDVITCQDVSNKKATCIKTCSSINPPKIGVNVTCQFEGKETSCENPYAGTTAIFTCERLYENRDKNERRAFVCHFGYWDFNPEYECKPVCGKKFVQPNKLIYGGQDAKESEYVWNIAVYYTKNLHRQICGGTIVTPKVSLSAAHCFVKYSIDKDAHHYVVGAGKSYRSYLDSRDNNDATQYKQLSNIILPEFFSFGADSRLDNDIAILILEKPFLMTSYVLPACLDQNNLFNHDTLSKINGTVVGWGWTEADKPSEHLKVLDVEYVKRQDCKLQYNYKRYFYPFVQDKICAGLYNQGKSACKGDSGNGLVFPAKDGRYYLRGIVSIAPKRKLEACDTNRYTLYTAVALHLDLINEQIAKFVDVDDVDGEANKIEPYENGCIVPQVENGRISDRQRAYFPDSDVNVFDIGTAVPNGTAIFYDCAAGFEKVGSLAIKCVNGEWSNSNCQPFCALYEAESESTIYECYENNKPVSCRIGRNGAVMKITCKPGYVYYSDVITPFAHCVNGQWSEVTYKYCRPACGLDYGDRRYEIAPNDGPTTWLEFPWHAGIYRRSDMQYLCSGVYALSDFIVTAKSCVDPYEPSEVVISIGNTYRQIDTNETGVGRIFQVTQIYDGGPLSKRQGIDIPKSISFLTFADIDKPADPNVVSNISSIHAICDGKVTYKFDQPGFFVSWEDPYSLDKSFNQLQKIQVIVRDPKVCNVTLAEGVCIEVVGKPICQRATGGGFVVKDYLERYNLVGLAVKTPPKGFECNLTHIVVELIY